MTESEAEKRVQDELHDTRMTLAEHLIELRRRMLIACGAVFVLFVIAFNYSAQILAFIEQPVLKYVGRLQFDTLTDPFFTHLKASFYAALFVGFPIVLSQIWLFIKPGLYRHEKQTVWPFLLVSFPLFVGGGLFLYYAAYPLAIEFLVNFDKTLVPSLRVGDYLSFTIQLLIVFGLVFEMPLIALFLTRLGVIDAAFLARGRRYAIVLIALAAAILTPPDVFSMMLLGVPMIVLYEISIIVCRFVRPRNKSL
jgi:sec-independent protein translocase protein TatC